MTGLLESMSLPNLPTKLLRYDTHVCLCKHMTAQTHTTQIKFLSNLSFLTSDHYRILSTINIPCYTILSSLTHHRMAKQEERNITIFGFQYSNMLNDISHVYLESFNVYPIPFTISMSNYTT